MYPGRGIVWVERNVGLDEIAEWMAAFEREPWGERYDDANHAATRATIVDVQRSEKDRKRRPIDARKYLIQRGKRKPGSDAKVQQTPAEMKAALAAWTGLFNNQRRRGRK